MRGGPIAPHSLFAYCFVESNRSVVKSEQSPFDGGPRGSVRVKCFTRIAPVAVFCCGPGIAPKGIEAERLKLCFDVGAKGSGAAQESARPENCYLVCA